MSSLTTGVALALIAGVLNGSFAAPIKYAKGWKWENIWAAWGLMGMLVFPWLIVVATLPDPWSIYKNVGAQRLLLFQTIHRVFGEAWLAHRHGEVKVPLSLAS